MKIIRDNLPEPLNYAVAPLFRNKLIHNKEFINFFKLLEDRENLDPEKIKEYQFNKLREILIYSFINVPYYKELFNKISFNPCQFSEFKQLEGIPFLTRELVVKNFDKLISTTRIDYYTGFTSGTTGLPLKFLLDYDSIYKENAFIYYYRKKMGYDFNDKIATFRNRGPSKFLWKLNPMYKEIMFSNSKLSKNTIIKYADKLNQLKPQFINGYISAIWYLSKLLQEYNINLDFKIKGIFLISEGVDHEQRTFIENFFNVKSMTFYGHSERVVIAEEIQPGRYVFDPYYGYAEQIPLTDGEYEIVGTGFLNKKMPFIRYNTNDVCSPGDKCFKITGKRNSTQGLYGIHNEFITATGFFLAQEAFKNIITFQFIQHEKGKADMFLVVNNNFSNEDLKAIKKIVDKQSKGVIDISIGIVDNLVLMRNGKFQKFISYVDQDE